MGTTINSIKSGDMRGGFDTLLVLLGLQKDKRRPCRSRLVKKRRFFDEAVADGQSSLVKKPLLFDEAALGG